MAGRPPGPERATYRAPLPEIAFMVEQVDREAAERDLARYIELKGAARTPEEQVEYRGLKEGQKRLKAAEAERQRIAGLPRAERAAIERQEKAEAVEGVAEMIRKLDERGTP